MATNVTIRTATTVVSGIGSLTISGTCEVTKEIYAVTVPHAGWKKWKNGGLIQDCLPELDDDQREFLISSTTPAEWKRMEVELDEFY